MSNEDEDEVEDELEAMEREATGEVQMPVAPQGTVIAEGDLPEVPTEAEQEQERLRRQKERAKARRVALQA